MLGDLTNPFFATWAAICVPSMARLAIAWTVFQRVRGWGAVPGRLPPYKQASDYPSPNRPFLEFRNFLVIATLALLPANAAALLAISVPVVIWPALYVGSLAVSVAWALRRLNDDDRRSHDMLARRLADGSGDRDLD